MNGADVRLTRRSRGSDEKVPGVVQKENGAEISPTRKGMGSDEKVSIIKLVRRKGDLPYFKCSIRFYIHGQNVDEVFELGHRVWRERLGKKNPKVHESS